MRQLEQSLRRLKTDHLDLWQIHEVRLRQRPRAGTSRRAARSRRSTRRSEKGKVRFVGFTGPQGPVASISRCCRTTFPSTPCQMPLNCLRRDVPELRAAGAARAAAARHRRARHEEPRRRGRARQEARRHRRRGAALRHEPARRRDDQRHRLFTRASTELENRAAASCPTAKTRCRHFAGASPK